MSLQVLRRSPRGPLDPVLTLRVMASPSERCGTGDERRRPSRGPRALDLPGPSRRIRVEPIRPPRAGAAPWRGSSPACQAPAAHPRAEEARARADARVSAAPDFASAVPATVPGSWVRAASSSPWRSRPRRRGSPRSTARRCFAGRRHDSHAAPATHCTCGLHAIHDPDDGRLKLGHPAVGVIAAWGEIEVYAAGFRAE